MKDILGWYLNSPLNKNEVFFCRLPLTSAGMIYLAYLRGRQKKERFQGQNVTRKFRCSIFLVCFPYELWAYLQFTHIEMYPRNKSKVLSALVQANFELADIT